MFAITTADAQKSEIFTQSGKAISGYDPVAYFTQGTAVIGNSTFSHTWKGAVWQFKSAENLERFRSDPEKFAPQYGGYCAYGMSNGYKAPTEKDAWAIVDGKLYLNYNRDVQKLWKEKYRQFITTADKNWPLVRGKEK